MTTAGRTLAALALAVAAAACSREAPAPTPAPAPASVGAPTVDDAGPGESPPAGSSMASSGPSDAGSPSADAGPPSLDAGAATAGPAPMPITGAVAIAGGQELPLARDRDGGTTVDPAASFSVEIPVHLTDGRMALLDEQDAMVTSSGTTEIGASFTRYRLVPEGPLRPGSSYTLQIDGAATREAHDPSGRAYTPLVLDLRTSGERPAAPAKSAKRKKGKRRH